MHELTVWFESPVEPLPGEDPIATRACKITARAMCMDASRVPLCHCGGDVRRCTAPRTYAKRAARVVSALIRAGIIVEEDAA